MASKKAKEDKTKEAEKPDTKEEKQEPTLTPSQITLKDLVRNINMLKKAIPLREKRLLSRVLRRNHAIRKRVTLPILSALSTYCPLVVQFLAKARSVQDNAMTDEEELTLESILPKQEDKVSDKDQTDPEMVPSAEVQAYVLILTTIYLLDQKLNEQAVALSTFLVEYIQSCNRRTLDLFSAQAYFYYSLAHERVGRLVSIRRALLIAHRSACLQHNEPGQAALTTCVLRNYLHHNLYAQADQFRLKSNFPDSASNNQYARYLYYIGKIDSVQLHYGEAYDNLSQAIRKAPQQDAIGFRQMAHKLMCIVQLLMGEIPERSIFRQKDLERSLKPYFQLTQAVRVGDLDSFNTIQTKYRNIFLRDKIYSLIVRLRHNVIKTGLRKINISYSKISMQDICQKLKLDNQEDAECIAAKAIHDDVIDAVIDRRARFMYSKENIDVYSTSEPQAVFHKRIQFCMDIHNGAVKALSFPSKAPTGRGVLEPEEKKEKEEEEQKTKEEDEKKEDKKETKK